MQTTVTDDRTLFLPETSVNRLSKNSNQQYEMTSVVCLFFVFNAGTLYFIIKGSNATLKNTPMKSKNTARENAARCLLYLFIHLFY